MVMPLGGGGNQKALFGNLLCKRELHCLYRAGGHLHTTAAPLAGILNPIPDLCESPQWLYCLRRVPFDRHLPAPSFNGPGGSFNA